MKQKELLLQLSKLIKRNNELQEKLQFLIKDNEKLAEKVEMMKKEKIDGGGVKAEAKEELEEKISRYDVATVMYAEVHGTITEKHKSDKYIDDLELVFRKFDGILEQLNITRLKSFGDSYICAGGIPLKNSTNPVEVVLAAFYMQQMIKDLAKKDNISFAICFGIHSGSTVMKHVGGKHDNELRGEMAHIANRLESWSTNNQINISETTYELVKEFFDCEYVGHMPVKFRDNMQVYHVLSIVPDLSINSEGVLPSERFFTKLSLMRFGDMQEEILNLMEEKLPKHLFYHNVKHTIDVVTQTELIGWGERVNDEELLLLKSAALFHDIGHIVTYDNHEEESVKIAQEYLTRYQYPPFLIEKICALILATKQPPAPTNKLEEIMCDADLDYLGRIDMISVSNNLFNELQTMDKVGSQDEWNQMQIKFISKHQYYTLTAQKLREVNKRQQIERLKALKN